MRVRNTSHIDNHKASTDDKNERMIKALYTENKILKAKLKIADELCTGEGGDLHYRFLSRTNNNTFLKKYL